MKPNPFASLNHFTLPLAIFVFSFVVFHRPRLPAGVFQGRGRVAMKKAPLPTVFRRESGATFSSGRSLGRVPESLKNLLDSIGNVQWQGEPTTRRATISLQPRR
jgi:hypothetical protein